MAVKKRDYIAFDNLAVNTTQKNLQIAYNATKAEVTEKISDDGITDATLLVPIIKAVSFSDITIYHSVEIQIKRNGDVVHNDWITLPVVPTGAVTKTVISGGRNILIRTSTGSSTVDIYAGVINQGQQAFE